MGTACAGDVCRGRDRVEVPTKALTQALAELDALLANPDHTGLPEAIQDSWLCVRHFFRES
jgi:hypothetical protein